MSLWIHELYLPLLIAAMVLACIIVVITSRMRETPGGMTFTAMMAGVAIWCLGCVVELLARTIDGKMLGCQIQYLGIASTPLNWFLLIVRYTQQDAWLTRSRLLLLWLIPCCTVVFMWTNQWHHLMYAHVVITSYSQLSFLHITYGPWFLLHISSSWLLVAAGCIAIVVSLRNIAPFYRRQTIALLVVALVPYLFNISYVLRLPPLGDLDLTPVAFALSGILLLVALRYFQIIRISPIARDAVFEHMLDGVVVLDSHRRVLDANPAICTLLGKTVVELYGADAPTLFAAWLPTHILDDHGGVLTIQLTDVLGTQRWFNLLASRFAKRRGWLLVLRDITDLHQLQERLNTLAFYDALTGLPNRMLANDRITQGLTQVRRRQTHMAVLFLDVDGFKTINDTLGHAMGDRLLHEVAKRLLACIRECDTVARVGGDEFIIVVADLANPTFAQITATRVLNAFATPFQLDNHTARLTASIGIAVAPDDGLEVETLLRLADNAMYDAKKRGKNTFVMHSVSAAPTPAIPQ